MAHAYRYQGKKGLYWIQVAMDATGRWTATASGPINVLDDLAPTVCRAEASTVEQADEILKIILKVIGA